MFLFSDIAHYTFLLMCTSSSFIIDTAPVHHADKITRVSIPDDICYGFTRNELPSQSCICENNAERIKNFSHKYEKDILETSDAVRALLKDTVSRDTLDI